MEALLFLDVLLCYLLLCFCSGTAAQLLRTFQVVEKNPDSLEH